MYKPNFIILGAPRSGTTSLYHYLDKHPDICMSSRQETWFFNVDAEYDSGMKHYEQYFSHCKGARIITDNTPMYYAKGVLYTSKRKNYYDPNNSAINRIAYCLPNTRFLLTLRHPVDRLCSDYAMNSAKGKKAYQEPLVNMLENHTGDPETDNSLLLYNSKYRIHLDEILSHVEKDRLKIIIFEEWINDVKGVLYDICDFLEISRINTDDQNFEVYNSGLRYKSRLSKILGHRLTGKLFDVLLPTSRQKQFSDTVRRNKTIPKETYNNLTGFYENDIKYIESFLGRRVNAWRNHPA